MDPADVVAPVVQVASHRGHKSGLGPSHVCWISGPWGYSGLGVKAANHSGPDASRCVPSAGCRCFCTSAAA
eukprot:462705-Pelagomonas_calceolata.AAC.4